MKAMENGEEEEVENALGTFDWPEDVWENIIAINYEAKKYKTALLQYRDLLEKLFDGISATRDFAWSSGDVIPSDDGPISPVSQLTPGSTPRTPVSQVGSAKSKGKRSVAAVQLLEPIELVQSLISAFTAQEASSTFEVLKVLKDIVNSYEIDDALFSKGLKLLGGKDEHNYKVIFLGIEPERRFSFLKAILS
ncbi:hypothetical protein GIB67_028785 [Kingdonia uniflora]|uniref:Uncharacterized protein n=1 Tax=Kingdonia uniflora TaxID=39325 RepID=A0A7J7M2C8_9MAGN|nr:hypothetical protein GIB67_028785 [Kingdonia uniflora]